MSGNNDLLKADQLIKAGKFKEARPVLENFIKEHRDHMFAWQLYAETWQTTEDRKRIWGYCLKVNPHSVEAKHALEILNTPQKQITSKITARQNPKTNWFFIIFASMAFIFIGGIVWFMITVVSLQTRRSIVIPAQWNITSMFQKIIQMTVSGRSLWAFTVQAALGWIVGTCGSPMQKKKVLCCSVHPFLAMRAVII